MLQAGRLQIRDPMNLPIIPAALGYGVYSASNINEYQKQKHNVSGDYSMVSA
jgi:hypothetical protein